MEVFALRDRIIDDFRQYVESFLQIADSRVSDFVQGHIRAGALWPDPILQLSPSYQMGPSIGELVADGMLHPFCEEFFGAGLHLYWHQYQAIQAARRSENYVLTTGTGSGKSLTYLVPIVDHIVRATRRQGKFEP